MTILLANDDGIDAPGLEALRRALAGLDDLLIVAPDGNRSGAGSSVSVERGCTATRLPDGPGGETRWVTDGTPADAVKFGLAQFAPGAGPRLVATGVNLGYNVGMNVRNSGTLGAAFEGAWAGIPSLAVSTGYVRPHRWGAAERYARLVAERMLAGGGPLMLSLNVPMADVRDVPGLRVTRQGVSGYAETFVPGDGGGWRFTGEFRHRDTDADTDACALRAGYASLTPLALDSTDHAAAARLRADGWEAPRAPEE